jgi:agmatinase
MNAIRSRRRDDSDPWLGRDDRFLGLDDDQADPQRSRCVILPAPFERTSSYRTGSHAGPGAILAASHQVELRDAALECEPWTLFDGIATRAPLETRHLHNGEAMARSLEAAVGALIDAGKRVVTLGGEHTSIVGAVKAHAERFDDLTILHLDAHSDLRESYLGDRWNHACTMARVADFAPKIVQVGIRSESAEDLALVERHGLSVHYGESILSDAAAGVDWIAPVIDACSSRVYVTFDCDVLDPSIMPATGTPEPGGLGWMHIVALFEKFCAERVIVGFDVSELAPIQAIHAPQFIMAKLIYRLLGLTGSTHAQPDSPESA